MRFCTNILLRFEAHQDQLTVFSRIQYPAEIRVFFVSSSRFAAKPFFIFFTSTLDIIACRGIPGSLK